MERRRSIGLTLLTCLVAGVSVFAQQRDQPPAPTTRSVPVGMSSVIGMVVDAATGRPVSGAQITLVGELPTPPPRGRGAGASSATTPVTRGGLSISMSMEMVGRGRGSTVMRNATTDAQGAFQFRHLPGGRYTANVTHRGYLPAATGQKKPMGPGTPFPLADGQKSEVELKLIRGGVVTGTIYGESGEPIYGAQVLAWRYFSNAGVRRLQQVNGTQTDDRGIFRVVGLQPGEYFLSATSSEQYFRSDMNANDEALIAEAIAAGGVRPPVGPGLPSTVMLPVVQRPPGQPFSAPPGFLPVYYPSASSVAGANIIKVVGGDEHSGVDIHVRQVRATNIEGVITNPPADDMRVHVSLTSTDPTVGNLPSTRTEPNGRFVLRNVVPGSYVIRASVVVERRPAFDGTGGPATLPPLRVLSAAENLWAQTPVTVPGGEPSLPVSLRLRAGRSISGHVNFDMTRPPDLRSTAVMVRISPAPGEPSFSGPHPPVRVEPDGTFKLSGVSAGRYVIGLSAPYLRSVMVNGEDALDFPIDFSGEEDLSSVVVTVTDQVSELSGVLTPAEGMSNLDYTIIVATTDSRYWLPGSRRVMIARAGSDNRYMVRGLPPGNYFIGVVTDLESGGQYDPEFLKLLTSSAGLLVTITEGEKVTRDIRAGG